MIDAESLRVLSDALHEGIILGRYGTPVQTLPYENWEGTWPEELSLDGFFFKRGDPIARGRYITGGSCVARPRHG